MPKGSRLPKNFKTFDFYDIGTRTAVSVKTIDTRTPARIKDPKQIYTSMKGNIDSVAGFNKHKKGEFEITSSMISQREVQVAVPKATTVDQWEQINRAIAYGVEKNVNVKIVVVK
ncbi:hypothetical protein C5472_09150 [Photorhabdus sp. RW14-46]|nr:hypothetical protein [Photorhabdus sp. RW14-46]NHB61290.1 hypothetical protein [Photorhabdus sp. RW14-46]